MADEAATVQWQDDQEMRTVVRWRYDAAKHAGLSKLEARLFAEGDGDLAELRWLADHGATPSQIARICI